MANPTQSVYVTPEQWHAIEVARDALVELGGKKKHVRAVNEVLVKLRDKYERSKT